MRKIFLLLLALPLLSYGQYGVPKKFSQIPVSAVPAVSASDYFVGTHSNGDGTFTDYLYQPSSSIVDTVTSMILGVTYAALDSGLQTRENSVLIYTSPITHAFTTQANTYYRCDNTAGSFVMTLPLRPPDLTQVGIKMTTQVSNNFIAVACAGGATFNKLSGNTTDTLHVLNEAITYEYHSADSTWTAMENDMPYSYVYGRNDTSGGGGPNPVLVTAHQFNVIANQIAVNLDSTNAAIDSVAGLISVTPTNVVTLTNKRITARDTVGVTYPSGIVTYNTNSYDGGTITGLSNAININVSGSPTDQQQFIIEIWDNGISQTLTFGSSIVFGRTISAPTSTAGNTTEPLTIELMAEKDGKFHAQGINQE